MSPQQKCQMKCAESATPCLMACTKGNPNESMKPENKGKTMACTRKCTEAQGPCMKACDKKAR